MIPRREFLMGAACVAAAATGAALQPRRVVTMLDPKKTLAELVPPKFGRWVSEDVADPLAVNGDDTLSKRLYNQLLTRVYENEETGSAVFMLLAYGGRQTDELQLHRPEVCYPAFGYQLLRNEPTSINLARGVSMPARRILAENDARQESVVYWTRIGEFLPTSGAQQRQDRFRIAAKGIIPDGLLSRFSAVGPDPEDAWTRIDGFIAELVTAVPAAQRKVLVGTDLANALTSAGRAA